MFARLVPLSAARAVPRALVPAVRLQRIDAVVLKLFLSAWKHIQFILATPEGVLPQTLRMSVQQ
eukprot:10052008-Prorocentrum_lima.AAC.1